MLRPAQQETQHTQHGYGNADPDKGFGRHLRNFKPAEFLSIHGDRTIDAAKAFGEGEKG